MHTLTEANLSQRLGIRNKGEFRRLRSSLQKGTDYVRSGHAFLYSENAAEKMAGRIASGPSEPSAHVNVPPAAEKRAPGQPDAPSASLLPPRPEKATPVVLTVLRNNLPNRSLLICSVAGQPVGPHITVRVPSAAHFIPRSPAGTILARPVVGSAVWEYLGNPLSQRPVPRIPRAPGRW